jgi:hypothetical protein
MRIVLALLSLLVVATAYAQQPPTLPPATQREMQLRIQLGEAMWELGMTQGALASANAAGAAAEAQKATLIEWLKEAQAKK